MSALMEQINKLMVYYTMLLKKKVSVSAHITVLNERSSKRIHAILFPYKLQEHIRLNNRLFREREHRELNCKGKQGVLTWKTV